MSRLRSNWFSLDRLTRLCLIILIGLLVFTPYINILPRETLVTGQGLVLPAPLGRAGEVRTYSLPEPTPTQGTTFYLPQVFNPDRLWGDRAIWVHDDQPAEHEVALFRHTFTLGEPLSQAALHLFADTRYELWIDGIWIGRGPARFSYSLREYDVYPLGRLQSGSHVVAILVQWAPNTRRSESLRPHLRGHIQGTAGGNDLLVARTGTDWKSHLSSAWRTDATPVHAWGLIGPTELLDLRKLPPAWNLPSFNDSDWSSAQVVSAIENPQGSLGQLPADKPFYVSPTRNHGVVTYQPRSIPFLVAQPVSPALIDAGSLSPGFIVGEITPPFTQPVELLFSNQQPTTFTMESLFPPGVPTDTIHLDGNQLAWQPVGNARPDVAATSLPLDPGEHRLTFDGISSTGMTFQVSSQDLQYTTIPFAQGVHAGRRLLLSDYASDLSRVKLTPAPNLGLKFSALPAYVVLDLGRTIHGRLAARVSGPAGTIVDIGWDERLHEDTHRPLPYPGSLHPEWNQVDSWILDGSARDIATIDARAGRYILIAAWGNGPVTLEEIRVYEERYPASQVGYFYSSDPLLNRIWQVGVETLYPNMVDAYTDTPWRERGQWWGDAYVADHVNRVAVGDLQILRRGLLYMADSLSKTSAPGIAPSSNGTHMLDYAMLWVDSLSEYVRLSGDSAFLTSVYPVFVQLMEHLAGFENASSSLLDLPQGPWYQTAYIDSLGQQSRFGQSTALNGLYYSTLLHAAQLAEQAGESKDAQIWLQKASNLQQRASQTLYLPVVKRFATTLYQGETYSPTPHAQAWALATGLVTEDREGPVTAALLALLSPDPSVPNLDTYGMFWVLEALGRNGQIDPALEIIKSYYGALLASSATTWWENYAAGNYQNASLSHAWGGSPTWFLSTYLLGARWTGPESWQVRPALTGVAFVSGSIPIQNDSLRILWERRFCQSSTLYVQSGIDTSGEVILPSTTTLLNVTLDGETVWQNGSLHTNQGYMLSDELHIQATGGQHTLILQFDC